MLIMHHLVPTLCVRARFQKPTRHVGSSFSQEALERFFRVIEFFFKLHQLNQIVNQRSEGFFVHHHGIHMFAAQRDSVLVPLTVLLILVVFRDEQNFGSAGGTASRRT
jgi:hypothetical protein